MVSSCLKCTPRVFFCPRHLVACGAESTRVCSSCQRTLCRNHGDCFCFESEAKRDEEKALRNQHLLTGSHPAECTSLSPLSPCFIPTLSSEPIFSSSFPSLGEGSSLLRTSYLSSPRMVTPCQSPPPPTGRQLGWGKVRKKQKMGRSTARTGHDAHSPSFLRQTFEQEENNKSVPASSSFSAKAQPGKTRGKNRRVSLGDGSPLSSSSSSTLL